MFYYICYKYAMYNYTQNHRMYFTLYIYIAKHIEV